MVCCYGRKERKRGKRQRMGKEIKSERKSEVKNPEEVSFVSFEKSAWAAFEMVCWVRMSWTPRSFFFSYHLTAPLTLFLSFYGYPHKTNDRAIALFGVYTVLQLPHFLISSLKAKPIGFSIAPHTRHTVLSDPLCHYFMPRSTFPSTK